MRTREGTFAVMTAASYLLAITGSALFHHHHGDHHDRVAACDPRPGVSASHSEDDHDCSVCQFLAQKPAPAAVAAPVELSTLVQEVAAAEPACVFFGVFTAWRSRAPPELA
jgi:hypothetical protein